jgi:hypothetical protein
LKDIYFLRVSALRSSLRHFTVISLSWARRLQLLSLLRIISDADSWPLLRLCCCCGKAGAAIGTTVLTQARNSFEDPVTGQPVLYLIGSAVSVVGICFIWLLVTQHNKTFEEEDVKFREFLEAEGYDTSKMELSFLSYISLRERKLGTLRITSI